jgi:hypothetical protein
LRRQDDLRRAEKLRTDEAARADESTLAQFIGTARVARNRLALVFDTAGKPIEGFGPFERFLSLAYAAPIALAATRRGISTAVYDRLGEFERAYGSMCYSLAVLRSPTPQLPMATTRSERKCEARAAAEEAGKILDEIRALFGDSTPVEATWFAPDEKA